MDMEYELWRAAGENEALHHVLGGLCISLASSGDFGRALVENAFRHADAVTEIASARLGDRQPQVHLETVIRVIDQLRNTALGGDPSPQGGI